MTSKVPDFNDIAIALFEICRQESDKIEHMEHVVCALPASPGIRRVFDDLRERNRRVAMAHDLFKSLATSEATVRQMAANGTVPITAFGKTA